MKKKKDSDQLSFFNLKIGKGDIILKSGIPYGEIIDESESLYYMQKASSIDSIPSPCDKKRLIERIIKGELSIDSMRY